MWSLTKLYLHAHHFLYKLDYNSKWNTQEKIPTNIKLRRSKINKGQSSKGKVQRAYGGELAWASSQGWKGSREDNEKETVQEVIKVSSGMCLLFFCFS